MTNVPHNPNAGGLDPDGMSHIDPELRSLAAELDLLAAVDGAASMAGFEDRIMQATLVALHGVEPIAVQAAELGASDRDAAPMALEERVFAESVFTLREAAPVASAPVLRHSGNDGRDDRAGDRHIRVARRVWWTNQYVRLAAAIVLVAGVGMLVRTAMTPSISTPQLTADQRVTSDLDLLFAVIDNRTSGSSDTSDTGSGTTTDPDELTKFLIEGATS